MSKQDCRTGEADCETFGTQLEPSRLSVVGSSGVHGWRVPQRVDVLPMLAVAAQGAEECFIV